MEILICGHFPADDIPGMSQVTHDQIELSMFLAMPVADGLDAVEGVLELRRMSTGQTKKKLGRVLFSLKLMFQQLAPRTTSEVRWADLERQIVEAIQS